jgi:hypothetical protein
MQANCAKRIAISVLVVLLLVASIAAQERPKIEAILCAQSGRLLSSCGPVVGGKAIVRAEDAGQPYLATSDQWRSVFLGIYPSVLGPFDYRVQATSIIHMRLRWRGTVPASALITVKGKPHEWSWRESRQQLLSLDSVRLPGGGKYSVTVAADHFQTRTVAVDASAANIQVGIVEIEPAQVIAGHVTDKGDGSPLAGATISAPDEKVLAIANGAGQFRIEILDPELRFLLIAYPQHATRKLSLAELKTQAVVQLSRAAELSLTIDRNGSSAKTIQVGIDRDDEQAEKLVKVGQKNLPSTANDLSFGNLEPGHYRITLRGDGPLQMFSTEADLPPGEKTTSRIRIEPGDLTVSVTFGDHPLPGATVEIGNSERGLRGTVTLNDLGVAVTEIWQGGTVITIVRSAVMSTPFISYRKLELSPETQLAIAIPDRRISGVVVDRGTGRPVPEADVTLSTQVNGESGSVVVVSDASGRFEFKGVKAGNESIGVTAEHYLHAAPTTFVLGEAENTRDLRIELNAGVSRTVRITTAGGSTAARASIVTVVGGQIVSVDEADMQGVATIPTPERVSSLLLIAARDGSLAARRLAPPNSAGDDPPIDVLLPPPSVVVRIIARSTKQEAVQGLGFMIRFDGEMIPFAAQQTLFHLPIYTNGNGEVNVQRLPEGEYEFWPFENEEDALAITAAPNSPAVRFHAHAGLNEAEITFKERK